MELKDYQRRLFPYAYNILGSYDDAIDAVQDVVMKYHLADKTGIKDEKNYLIRGVINQSINVKKHKSKTSGSKVTLPEPIATENADSDLTKKDILSYSLLVLLDSLNEKERAVFILKEAFDYHHEEIAETLGFTTENSRKLLSRAKTKLTALRPNNTVKHSTDNRQLLDYINAIQSGNLKSLEEMFAQQIRIMTDGGNINIVADKVEGMDKAIQLMAYVYHTYQNTAVIKVTSVNHQPAILFYQNDTLSNCQVFDINPETGTIQSIFSIVDPEKLKNFQKI